jgi:hypothetical protein
MAAVILSHVSDDLFCVMQAFDLFGQQLLQADHFASGEVEERLESMAAAREDLEKAWIARRMQLDQCLELQLFYRYLHLASTVTSIADP